MATQQEARGRVELVLEALEQRLLLSGNVIASVASGSLVLTGDAGGNAVTVDQVGLSATQLRLTPAGGTTINGSAGIVILDGVTKDIRADLGEGGDILGAHDVSLPGGVVFVDTQGSSWLGLMDCTFGGSITMTTKEGNDLLSLDGVLCLDVKVQRGNGDNEINIKDSLVNGSVSVKTVEGTHNITLDGSTIVGAVKVANGPGDSSTQITDSSVHGSVSVKSGYGYDACDMSGALLGGSLKLDFGTGGADVQFENASTIEGSLSLKSGEGLNSLSILSGAEVKGATKLSYAYSSSALTFDHCKLAALSVKESGNATPQANFADSTVSGKVSLSYGTGEATVIADTVEFHSSVAVKSAGALSMGLRDGMVVGKVSGSAVSGDCALGIHGMTLQSTLSWKTTAARDMVSIVLSDIWGTAKVATGAVEDTFTLFDCILHDAFALDTGDGPDVVHVDLTDGLPLSVFLGPLSIKTGNHDDMVVIGATTAGDGIDTRSSVLLDGGSGTDSLNILGHVNVFLMEPTIVGFEAVV